MVVQLKKSELLKAIDSGMTLGKMAEQFGISPNNVKKAITSIGLNYVPQKKKVVIEVVDDTEMITDTINNEDFNTTSNLTHEKFYNLK